jgi:hypothetical protein
LSWQSDGDFDVSGEEVDVRGYGFEEDEDITI